MFPLTDVLPELWVGKIIPGWSCAQVAALRHVCVFFAHCLHPLDPPPWHRRDHNPVPGDLLYRALSAWPHDEPRILCLGESSPRQETWEVLIDVLSSQPYLCKEVEFDPTSLPTTSRFGAVHRIYLDGLPGDAELLRCLGVIPVFEPTAVLVDGDQDRLILFRHYLTDARERAPDHHPGLEVCVYDDLRRMKGLGTQSFYLPPGPRTNFILIT